MKWIEARSGHDIEDYCSDTPWAAISISTQPNTWPHLSSKNRVGVLQLTFANLTNLQCVLDSPMFNMNHALQVLDFMKWSWGLAESYLVHAEEDLARSSAVAAAMLHIHYGKESCRWHFENCRPNIIVYRTILRAHFSPYG